MALTVVVLAGCGQTNGGAGADTTDAGWFSYGPMPGADEGEATSAGEPRGSTVVDPDSVLTGQGLILQEGDEPPMICLGGVAESYPPQCSGPELVGLDWGDLSGVQSAQGVKFAEAAVVGRFDGETFTLTEPPGPIMMPVEPDGGTGADSFGQLCDDPFRDGDERIGDDPKAAARAEEALAQALESYDGIVGTWVSTDIPEELPDDEVPLVYAYNVLVTGDPEQAHTDLRQVWRGGLCVEQRDAATEADVRQAQTALNEATIDGFSSSGGSRGVLVVGVLLADQQTVDAVYQAVAPWLTPEQVSISSSLVPVQRD
ncbi:MAG: hypothetical protein WA880_15310 [Ornithinimicrobium sp.]